MIMFLNRSFIRYSFMGLYGGISAAGLLLFQKPLLLLCSVPYTAQTVINGLCASLLTALVVQMGLAALFLSLGMKTRAAQIYNHVWTIFPTSLIINGWLSMILYLMVVHSPWAYAITLIIPMTLVVMRKAMKDKKLVKDHKEDI